MSNENVSCVGIGGKAEVHICSVGIFGVSYVVKRQYCPALLQGRMELASLTNVFLLSFNDVLKLRLVHIGNSVSIPHSMDTEPRRSQTALISIHFDRCFESGSTWTGTIM